MDCEPSPPSSLRTGFAGMVMLVVLLLASFLQAQAKRVAVYRDAGVWAAEGSRALPSVLEWLGHDWTWVDARQIEAGELNQNGRPAFDLLVVPGGWAGDYITKVGGWRGQLRGDDELRSFVAGGGGYLGFCAGAFAAASTTRWSGRNIAYSWKLFDGIAEGPLPSNGLRRGGLLRAGHGTAGLDLMVPEFRGRQLPALVRPMGGRAFYRRPSCRSIGACWQRMARISLQPSSRFAMAARRAAGSSCVPFIRRC